jgi:dUTP pyrophosphatase
MTPLPALKFKLVHSDAKAPFYATAGAAGMDVTAVFDDGAVGMIVEPGARAMISTGLKIEVPTGYEVQVRPRSGLAAKHGIMIVNSPGTIDCDYRGEVNIILINTGDDNFMIEPGDRIAQLVVKPAPQHPIVVVTTLSETVRGEGGFGSTGVKAA